MQQMNTEYFSGSQASIFIGDLWVDDISDWQYQIDCSSAPIYGYGDQFYSHVAGGKVLVQGSFVVNFREPNYLWAILARNDFRKKRADLKQDPLKQKNLGRASSAAPTDVSFLSDKRVNLDYFFNATNTNEATDALKKERGFDQNRLSSNILENDFDAKTFDILIGYGHSLGEDSPGERIIGVKITGKGKVIYSDGTPIKERYTFFARNVI